MSSEWNWYLSSHWIYKNNFFHYNTQNTIEKSTELNNWSNNRMWMEPLPSSIELEVAGWRRGLQGVWESGWNNFFKTPSWWFNIMRKTPVFDRIYHTRVDQIWMRPFEKCFIGVIYVKLNMKLFFLHRISCYIHFFFHCTSSFIIPFFLKICWSAPVSYTHLDVYKRQH